MSNELESAAYEREAWSVLAEEQVEKAHDTFLDVERVDRGHATSVREGRKDIVS